MTKLILFSTSLFAFGSSGVCQSAPNIVVNVLTSARPREKAEGPYVVKKRELIEVEVVCQSSVPSTLKAFSYAAVNPTKISANEIRFIMNERDLNGDLTLRINKAGAGQKAGQRSIFVNLQIPESAAIRRQKLQSAINRAEGRGPVNLLGVADLDRNRELILSLLDAQYVENRRGQFQLFVSYHCTEPDVWSGTVSSEKVAIDMTNDNTSVDALGQPDE